MTGKETGANVVPCGETLRGARENLGLTIEDVASELRLSAYQISALEEDDWDRLPGTTYARGYLRTYARLLGLDVEQLIQQAGDRESQTNRESDERNVAPSDTMEVRETQQAPAVSGREQDIGTTSGGKKLYGTLGLLFLIICGAGIYLWFEQPSMFLTDGVSIMGDQDSTDSTAQSNDSDNGSEVVAEASESSSSNQQSKSEPQRMEEMIVDDRHIVFEFTQDSWVDVRDTNKQRLLYRSFREGQTVQVEGDPPFRIFVGFVDGVTVKYQGEVVDYSKNKNRLSARFKLPALE